ncbi:MAG: hypothetical protein ISS70_12240 [Phycisphaerae bacterium]|nr:hypothetical protein [Phycisphaerae bacterium]
MSFECQHILLPHSVLAERINTKPGTVNVEDEGDIHILITCAPKHPLNLPAGE